MGLDAAFPFATAGGGGEGAWRSGRRGRDAERVAIALRRLRRSPEEEEWDLGGTRGGSRGLGDGGGGGFEMESKARLKFRHRTRGEEKGRRVLRWRSRGS
jgi:hypothetical protein